MKDYSQFFKNIESSDIDSAYGFITKLEVVGGEVHVWTPLTKKGEPHKYPLDKISHFLKRLEKQYKEIIDNQDVVKKAHMKKTGNIIKAIVISTILPLMAIGATIMAIESTTIGLIVLIASPVLGTILGTTSYAKEKEKFDEEMSIYECFITKRKDIESLSKTDENVTANLQKKTKNIIKTKEELKNNGVISQTYDIDLMDKAELKEIKKLITNYNGSKSLFIPQEFVNPNETHEIEEPVKTRSLKK